MVEDRAEAMRRLRVYHASVDTGSRAMDTTIEDELAQVRVDFSNLQRDHQAQTELLNEETATVTSLRGEVETLSAQLDTLTGEHDKAIGQVATLKARVTELEASQTDFDKRLQMEVARLVASTGTTMPARVTPAGDNQAAVTQATSLQDLVAEYTRLVNANKPDEAAAFYHQHLASHFNR
jgi:chromosome segregation ATPase